MVSHLNVGSGVDVTIRELAETIKKVVGYEGDLKFDSTKPDGPPRKLLDVGKLKALGWEPGIDLTKGLEDIYAWFLEDINRARG